MSSKTFNQVTAHEFAGLTTDMNQKLRKGSMSSDQLRWFVNLSFKQRETLMNGGKDALPAQQASTKFEATELVVSTTPTGKTYNIKKDITSLIATKADGGLFDWVDDDIAGWFGSVSFTDAESVSGKVQLFKNAITHRDIIAEGENLGTYEEYELGYALFLANELVKAKAIEKPGYGVIIYLKEKKGDTRCRLRVYRRGDGELGVDINEVDPGLEWYAGVGVLFSN